MGNREQFWQAHVDACRVSGITQKAYCERNGITPKTFRIWRTRLAVAVCATTIEGEPHGGEVRGGAKEFFSPSSDGPLDQAQLVDLLTNPRFRRTWTPEQRQQIVIDALHSGMSINRFARVSGLTPSALYHWKHELAARVLQGRAVLPHDAPRHPAAAPMFASVQAAPAPSGKVPHAPCDPVDAPARDTVEVVLVNGRRVRFHAQMDARTLHALLSALESSP